VTPFRKALLALGFSLLFIYLQLQFERSSPRVNLPERRADVRHETYDSLLQPSQVIEALLRVPPIIQLPPGWSEASAAASGSAEGAAILTLPKDGALG
jgi:hypothetical protein